MREYTKVAPRLWRNQAFLALPDDSDRYLYLYLKTNEHQTSAGAYRLPAAYAMADLHWPADAYFAALERLRAAGLVLVDEDTEEIAIAAWFVSNGPMNEAHCKGIAKQIEQIESAAIRNQTTEALRVAMAELKSKPARPSGTEQLPPTISRFARTRS
jgi:hypothetical protein